MRRLSFAVLLAALVVAVLPITAEANHTLAHKVRKLQGKVTVLQAKMSCLRRVGASTYAGYPYYEGIFDENNPGPYPIHTPSTGFPDSDIASLFDQATGVRASDYWLLTLNNTAACRRKFAVVRSPYARVAAARTNAMSRLYRLSRAQ
jgi:hypothetical protein